MGAILVILDACVAFVTIGVLSATYLDFWIGGLPYKNELKTFFVHHGIYAVVASMALASVSATLRPGHAFFYWFDFGPSSLRFFAVNGIAIAIFFIGWYALPAVPLAKELLISLVGFVWWDMLFNQRQNRQEFKYWMDNRGSLRDLGSMVASQQMTIGVSPNVFTGEVVGIATFPIRRGFDVTPHYTPREPGT